MATDDALLDEVAEAGEAGGAFLRLYCWDRPTLSIGRNQSESQIESTGIPVVRRPTGGQAVLHQHELTYAVVAPVSRFGSLRAAYAEIHSRLATALRRLGVDAVLAPRPPRLAPAGGPRPRPNSCFADSVGGEILVNGRKLVGSAQVRRGTAFLQHGSILIDGAQPGSFNREITLRMVLARSVSFEEVASVIIESWPEPFAVAPASRPVVIASLPRA
ncbi:MAG TPA: hypothetical protein VG454_07350 [Gemmatimonadales bacterium]|nr:hypothetical protein [Gemmatimonadales bacterium]